MSEERIALRVRVTGKVQGVGFRDWAMREAQALGLSGFIRNDADGTVSGLIAGDGKAMAAMVARLSEGPSHASVDEVVTEAADPGEAPPTFRITG